MELQAETCQALFEYLDEAKDDFVEELIRICEIPAPTFHEERRGEYLASLFARMGLPVERHETGNVEAAIWRNGPPHVVLSAHMDTVFPFDYIRVLRDKSQLKAPGISDNAAGLAALVHLARAFLRHPFPHSGSLTLLATVGEEGLGNLRGIRRFFETNAPSIDYFVSLDGSDAERLVIRGLTSKRVRIHLRGPGGHSWGDAGTANPIHAAGYLLLRIANLPLPRNPKSSINVGMIHGGTSVNVIPTEVSLDVDLRSESDDALKHIDCLLQQALHETVQRTPQLCSEISVLGERPYGEVSIDHPLVKTAVEASHKFGIQPKLDIGSTDSNIPLSLGLPAITTGVGGRSGKVHTPEEWYDVTNAERGMKRTALMLADLLKPV